MLTIDNTVDGGYGNELPRISIHQDFKCVCVSVCVSVCNGSGKFGAGTTIVTHTLYCVCVW